MKVPEDATEQKIQDKRSQMLEVDGENNQACSFLCRPAAAAAAEKIHWHNYTRNHAQVFLPRYRHDYRVGRTDHDSRTGGACDGHEGRFR